MHQLTWLGLALILIGLALVLAPLAAKYFDISRVPAWLLYIYRSDGFYFVTSPVLLLLSLLFFALYLLRR
jgi:hypothetical protein